MLLLGIDVGTTSVKAMVFDPDGTPLSCARRNTRVSYPAPGHAEQDSEAVWALVCEAVWEASREYASRIAAMSVSVQGDAIIPIDDNLAALGPAQLGMDYRTASLVEKFSAEHDAYKAFQRTGMRPHPLNSAFKILWLFKNDPALAGRVRTFATYSDYLLGKLGSDQMVIDTSMASRTMLYNTLEKNWDTDMIEAVGLSIDQLSLPVKSGRVVGKLRKTLAEKLGLSPDVLLVTGGHDQTCAAFGSGVIREGFALDSHGTAEVISTCFKNPRFDAPMFEAFYPCYLHVAGDPYFTFALNHTAGILFQWFKEQFVANESLSELAASVPSAPSTVLALPHFNGSGTPTCDADSRGALIGLTLSSTKSDIAGALLDSMAFEMRINLERLAAAGIPINDLRCVGGGAELPQDMQRKADVFQIPVSTLRVREAACLGAAFLAGCGAGVYADPIEAASKAAVERVYEPGAMLRPYNERYELYTRLYDTLKPINYACAASTAVAVCKGE